MSERERFEAWAERQGYWMSRRGELYRDEKTDDAWYGWQSALASSQAATLGRAEERLPVYDEPQFRGDPKFADDPYYIDPAHERAIEDERRAADRADLVMTLTSCVEDPMWADHAEILKSTLRKTIAALAANPQQIASGENK